METITYTFISERMERREPQMSKRISVKTGEALKGSHYAIQLIAFGEIFVPELANAKSDMNHIQGPPKP